jgi:hypothetical protein
VFDEGNRTFESSELHVPRRQPKVVVVFLIGNIWLVHTWSKRRLNEWLNHAAQMWIRTQKAQQIGRFTLARRPLTTRPIRPVTPEVAGSSPVAPAS